MKRDATTAIAMTARQARKRGVWVLAGLPLTPTLPGMAFAGTAPPAITKEWIILPAICFIVALLTIWSLACAGCLWLALRGRKSRAEKTVCCIAATIVFVSLPLIDITVLGGNIARLFFDLLFSLPAPVVGIFFVSICAFYAALPCLGMGWGLAKISECCSARSAKHAADKDNAATPQ